MNCVYAMFDNFPVHGQDARGIDWKCCKYIGMTRNIKERIIEHKKNNGKGIIREIEKKYGNCVMLFWDAGSCADMMLTELFMILKLKPEFNSESSMKDMGFHCPMPIQRFALSRMSPYKFEVAYTTNGFSLNNRKVAKWRIKNEHT